jgi:hypothetical protein
MGISVPRMEHPFADEGAYASPCDHYALLGTNIFG